MVQGQRQRSESREIGMNLRPPEKVRKLQRTLHAKAKESPNYRFYALYDKVYREDILYYAYRTCKAKGGAAGVDRETFEDIESYGRERWLGELSEALRSKSYRTSPIRRVYIPKANGKQRPGSGDPDDQVESAVVHTSGDTVLWMLRPWDFRDLITASRANMPTVRSQMRTTDRLRACTEAG